MLLMRCRTFKGNTGFLAPQEANNNHSIQRILHITLNLGGLDKLDAEELSISSSGINFYLVLWESAQYPPMLSPVCAINTGQWGKAAAPSHSPRNNNITGNYERVRENIWQMFASLWVTLWHLTGLPWVVCVCGLLSPLQQSQPPAPSAPAY